MRVAALTMVWNEPYFLPRWLRHYARQVGEANCFVIDHGSDDGSTVDLGEASRIRLPRTPLDEEKRAACVSDIAAGLLAYYDAVVHSDADELVLPDPEIAADLVAYCARESQPVTTAVGLDVSHWPDREPPIDPQRSISEQRGWVRFVSPMCKPVLIRRPVRWAPGFHSADAPIRFGRLFNFHLRRHDLAYGLRRLAKTRAMARAYPWVNEHQQISDAQFAADFDYPFREMPAREHVSLRPDEAPLKPFIEAIETAQRDREGETYRLDLGVLANEFWRLPPRFVGLF